MKRYLLLLTIYCLVGVPARSQTTEENDALNTPHNGTEPCERPTQIETNPFNLKNTEWYTQHNRFNCMDFVTTKSESGTSVSKIIKTDNQN
ncbi:MAG: hypothetical protein MUE96_07315 [Bacteroidia bacterium]|jgi:hypothetical protein|nr:hypothetical protein [Bacteroidia bacterium]